MKKNILNDIDKVKEERKLSKEMEKKIFTKAILNWGIGVSIIILIMLLNFTKIFLTKEATINVYNICAIFFLAFSIMSIEIGYKKDSEKWAATSIEMIVLSIFILFAPQIFITNNYTIMRIFIILVTIYYSCKIIGIYCIDKKRYLKEISDISNIIKKESKDNLVEQEKEKRKEELRNLLLEEKTNNKKVTKKPKKTKKTENDTDINKNNTEIIENKEIKEEIKPQKRTRKKKVTDENVEPKTKEKETNVIQINEEKTKRGRGRPRKNTLPESIIEKTEEILKVPETEPESQPKSEDKPKTKRTRTPKKVIDTSKKVNTKPEEKTVTKQTRTATKKKVEETETTPKAKTTTRKPRTTTKKENNKQGE